MNIARVNIGVLTGWKKIKQRRISFVLGYLRMIFQLQLHRILATFNIKKIIWQPVYWTTSNIHIWTSAIYILSVACKYKDILHDYFPLKLIGKYLLLYNKHIYHIFRLKYRCFVYALSMIVPSLYRLPYIAPLDLYRIPYIVWVSSSKTALYWSFFRSTSLSYWS